MTTAVHVRHQFRRLQQLLRLVWCVVYHLHLLLVVSADLMQRTRLVDLLLVNLQHLVTPDLADNSRRLGQPMVTDATGLEFTGEYWLKEVVLGI